MPTIKQLPRVVFMKKLQSRCLNILNSCRLYNSED